MRYFQLAAILIIVGLKQAVADTPSASLDQSAGNQLRSTAADGGDTITVTVANTCPAVFTYAQIALQGEPEAAATNKAGGAQADVTPQGCGSADDDKGQEEALEQGLLVCEVETQNVFIIHDKQYGGYVISIHAKKGFPSGPWQGLSKDDYTKTLKAYKDAYATNFTNDAAVKSCEDVRKESANQAKPSIPSKVTTLNEVIDTVVVSTAEPLYELAGGLTVSNLVDPRYSSVPVAPGSTTQIIMEDKSAEDTRRLGFAGFIHVHDPYCTGHIAEWWCEHIAASLGIGISSGSSNSSSVSAFFGPSFRLAGQWFVTAGYNWGAIARLPNGDRVGAAPLSSNDLSNLGTRTSGAFFFALSYAFLSPGTSFFQKPFSTDPTLANNASGQTQPQKNK